MNLKIIRFSQPQHLNLLKINQIHSSKVKIIQDLKSFNADYEGDGIVTSLRKVGIAMVDSFKKNGLNSIAYPSPIQRKPPEILD